MRAVRFSSFWAKIRINKGKSKFLLVLRTALRFQKVRKRSDRMKKTATLCVARAAGFDPHGVKNVAGAARAKRMFRIKTNKQIRNNSLFDVSACSDL